MNRNLLLVSEGKKKRLGFGQVVTLSEAEAKSLSRSDFEIIPQAKKEEPKAETPKKSTSSSKK